MMIELRNVNKKFNIGKPNELFALRDISMNVERGEMLAIMGRSGAGKSTLLHIIGCLDTATDGMYKIDGIDASNLSDSKLSRLRNEKIGILLQDFALVQNETALQNVMWPLYFNNTPITKMHYVARAALSLLGIDSLEKQLVSTMSGGQKQRVALARALVNKPSVILADEPTGALDSVTADEILCKLTELNYSGVTIIIVTHDEKIASNCKRTIRLSDGAIM